MRIAEKVELTEEQHKQLKRWSTGRTFPVRLAERAKMILLAAQCKTDKEIGSEIGVWRGTVGRWRKRFIAQGLPGIERDKMRPGRRPAITAHKVCADRRDDDQSAARKCNPLEYTLHGDSGLDQRVQCAAYLARART